jgi:hypothetical protein
MSCPIGVLSGLLRRCIRNAKQRRGLKHVALYASYAPIAVFLPLIGCATPSIVREVEGARSADFYEAIASGCDNLQRTEVRRFVAARNAVLWARQRVGTAPLLPCEVTLHTVVGATRTPVYMVTRSASGERREQLTNP